MSNIRCETIGPVVQEDFVVSRVGEWDSTVGLKRWTAFM